MRIPNDVRGCHQDVTKMISRCGAQDAVGGWGTKETPLRKINLLLFAR
jgi:hypothetical protein